ncbi:MAG: hypothetical protein EBY66_00800 [Candidatus Fonsibacter lacus]|nr:hypothetical protein [Candidatus Fonsibacter lacus]
MPHVSPMQTRTQPSDKFSKVGWTDEAADSISEFRRSLWVMTVVVEGGEVVIHQCEQFLRAGLGLFAA